MGKLTGYEKIQDVPQKVQLLYEAVALLIMEGADIKDIRVSTITDKAGIGKGTAYDYFDSKEEILACAVIYYMRKEVDELRNGLSKYSSFAEQLNFLLEEIEKDSAKKQCLIKYVHLMTDTSDFSRIIQKKMHDQYGQKHLPIGVYKDIIEDARKRGEVKSDLTVDYMVYVLFSKIMFYMICLGEDSIMNLDEHQIRPYVHKSILDELCEKKV